MFFVSTPLFDLFQRFQIQSKGTGQLNRYKQTCVCDSTPTLFNTMTYIGVILRALSHQSEPEVEVCLPEPVSTRPPECSPVVQPQYYQNFAICFVSPQGTIIQFF